MKKSFFEKICATQVLPTGVKSGEWYFFKWAQSSFSDKQIRTASKNTECFVENALAMLNIRVMTHPRSPLMVRQARQPGGSGRRTESGFADAFSDWSRLTNLAVPVAGPRAGSRKLHRTGAGHQPGGSGRRTCRSEKHIATIKKEADLLSQPPLQKHSFYLLEVTSASYFSTAAMKSWPTGTPFLRLK